MTSLAVSLIAGADDASDINLLASLVKAGLITEHPSDSTVHRRHAELADLGTAEMLDQYAKALKTVRTKAWRLLGEKNPAACATERNPLIVDSDATEVTSHSGKEGATATWKKHFVFYLSALGCW